MTTNCFDKRKAIYRKIEAEYDTKVISYVTGDRTGASLSIEQSAIDVFIDHLDALWPELKANKKLTLILYTCGGDTAAAWRLINLIRSFCEELEIIVISKALSAGTLMCLGANKIIMTKQATLGPIDPSVTHPLAPQLPGRMSGETIPASVEDIHGYLDIAREELHIKAPELLMKTLLVLSEQVHPIVLGSAYRSRMQIRNLANELLEYQNIAERDKKRIIKFLCSDSGRHDHTLNRREARKLGLNVDNPTEEFYPVLKELQNNIDTTLALRDRFDPFIEIAKVRHSTGTSAPPEDQASIDYKLLLGAIESVQHGCHYYIHEGKIQMKRNAADPNKPLLSTMPTYNQWRKTI